MIWKNIKIGLWSFVILLLSLLVTLSFLKIEIATVAILSRSDVDTIIVNDKDGKYIETNEIKKVKMKFNNQYYICNINYLNFDNECFYYVISLPKYLEITNNYQNVNLVLGTTNFYTYFF